MELVKSISDTLEMVQVKIVDMIDRGGGLVGYYIVKIIPEKGALGGW